MTSIKSTAITNLDATPQVQNSAHIVKGMLCEAVGTLEVSTSEVSNSKLFFCRVPSNARISQVLLSCDDTGTAGAVDIGVYKSTADGGTVVDVDHFASAQVLTTALVNSDVSHEADAADAGAGFGVADVEKPLWSSLGLTSDPCIAYDIVGTVTQAVETAGTVSVKVRYVI